jgi:triphosphatase
MGREIELKLALDAEAAAALSAVEPLANLAARTERLLALYFDTPRNELSGSGMALRLRRSGRRWKQALKAGTSGLGGLHERSEWEFDRRGPVLDLSLFAGTPLATLEDAATLHERLEEAFRVESRRTTWMLEVAPGTRVEIVLDAGRVTARGREDTVSEIEIESLEGDAAAVFDVAAMLLDRVRLRPSALSKAERGYRLRANARRTPVKAPEIHLRKSATPLEAARATLGAGLAQLQGNEEGLLVSADPEFVHQARVALRRMRSALRIFRDVIGIERSNAWREALAESAVALGAARDWDVFTTETLPPVLAAHGDAALAKTLRGRATRRRTIGRESARAALRSSAYVGVILEIARWLCFAEPPPMQEEPLEDFASRLVRKRHKRLLADASRIPGSSAQERHQLRIDVKRLRYGVDALSSLFPAKRVARYIDILVALQDTLGASNDAATALRLLPELEPPESFAAFARGWFAARASGDRGAFEALLESLSATQRFWRGATAAETVTEA